MKVFFINNNDETIFKRIKDNDEKAFEWLFKKYYAPLCRYVYTHVKDQDDSENITQEVLIHIWNNRRNVTIHTSVSSYLYRSVKNHAINFLKKNSKHVMESIENMPGFEIANEAPEIDENEFSEIEKKISEAFDLLPEKCKRIFLMSRIDNLKYREIAEQLNISIKTVETQMSIALKKLKTRLLTQPSQE